MTLALPEEVVKSARRGEVKKIVKWIKKGGVDAQRDTDGNSLLHSAVIGGQPDVVRELLKQGATVDLPNHDGSTPLMAAAQGWQPNAAAQDQLLQVQLLQVQLLLENSADVNRQTAAGATALMSAAAHKRQEVMAVLLEASANIDIQTTTGDTALIVAATYGADKCVAILVSAGASTSIQNDQGDTALRCAEKKGHVSTQLLLQSVNKQPTMPASEIGSRQARLDLAPDQVRIRTNDGKNVTVHESAVRPPQSSDSSRPSRCLSERNESRRALLAKAMRG